TGSFLILSFGRTKSFNGSFYAALPTAGQAPYASTTMEPRGVDIGSTYPSTTRLPAGGRWSWRSMAVVGLDRYSSGPGCAMCAVAGRSLRLRHRSEAPGR